jgi:hypothetical protein
LRVVSDSPKLQSASIQNFIGVWLLGNYTVASVVLHFSYS